MTALAKNKSREHKVHERQMNIVGANAGETFYTGGYLLREAATGLGTKVVAAGNVPLGVITEQMFPDDPDKALTHALDNSAGLDGVVSPVDDGCLRCLRYDQRGEYAFAVASGTPKVGAPAYLVDDNTVDTAASATGISAGTFTRPAAGGGWFIDIAKRGVLGDSFAQQDAEAPLAGTVGTANDTLTALPTLTDSPASADALRDDLTTNWAPAINNNIADIQTKLNALIVKLEFAGVLATYEDL